MLSLLSFHGRISRKAFTLSGLILFAIKYNLDRLIALQFDRSWFITDYFMQVDHLSVNALTPEEQKFYLVLIVVSVPFIWIGTALCLKRLRDTSLPLWLIAMFFIPLLNILFFMMLCIFPSASSEEKEISKPHFLEKIIPESETGSILFSIIVTIFIAVLVFNPL